MSEEKRVLTLEELEEAVGGRNEVKRRRNVYEQQLLERQLKTQGAASGAEE
jgi:hypothetical protein